VKQKKSKLCSKKRQEGEHQKRQKGGAGEKKIEKFPEKRKAEEKKL